MNKFDKQIYRSFNPDLVNLSDFELVVHYHLHNYEKRIYGNCSNDVEIFSMRWLRGNGLEIGAGKYPTPLFGNASVTYADCDPELLYGGAKNDFFLDLNKLDDNLTEKYDFVIASHVLEHVDSFIMSIKNLIKMAKKNGYIYITLPDINFLNDKNFILNYDFDHHIKEYNDPLFYAEEHDSRFTIAMNSHSTNETNYHAEITKEYLIEIQTNTIKKHRFMHHKHNYSFINWTKLLIETNTFLGDAYEIVDMRFGHLRSDCHYILHKNKI